MQVNIGNYRIRKVSNIIQETPNIVSIEINDEFTNNIKPGQFVMLSIPGYEEIPMSISGIFKNSIRLSVAKRGKTTERIHKLVQGEMIGIRGPFGNGFSLQSNKPIIVGGGIGLAPLMPLIHYFESNKNLKIIVGSRTKSEIPFKKYLDKLSEQIEIIYYTDDGTYGNKGTAVDGLLRTKLSKYDKIYTCGPELMMKSIFDIAIKNQIDLEASLERYMKCGVGICGHCAMDPIGWRVCKDGPVANKDILRQLSEFGKYYRDKFGLKIIYKN